MDKLLAFFQEGCFYRNLLNNKKFVVLGVDVGDEHDEVTIALMEVDPNTSKYVDSDAITIAESELKNWVKLDN